MQEPPPPQEDRWEMPVLPVQAVRPFSPQAHARVPSQESQAAFVGQSQSVPSVWQSPEHLAYNDGIAGIYYDIDGRNSPELVTQALMQSAMPPQEPAAAAAPSIAFDNIDMILGQE